MSAPEPVSPARIRRVPVPLLAVALLFVPGCGRGEEQPEDLPPSVILVSLDTARRDHLSLYGYERDTTPFLDRLAEECLVFTHAYSTSNFTLTSHMSMLTGLYPSQHGVDRESALSPEVPLLAERLRRLGYWNVAVYRDGWIDERFGYDRGFDVFVDRRDAESAGLAMREALADRPRDRPLFLFLHVFDAHCKSLWTEGATIYEPPPDYADLFRAGAAARMRARPARAIYEGEVEADGETAQDLVALYDASLRFLDDELAGWVDYWRSIGLLERSLLVVTSDHGEALGSRGTWQGHGGLWEAGMRIPLLLRLPDRLRRPGLRGRRVDRLVSTVDLVPTVMELLGEPVEPWVRGRSLLAEPDAAAEGRVVYAEADGKRAVTDGTRKALVELDRRLLGVWDLARDPKQARELPPTDERRRAAKGLLERVEDQEAGRPAPPGSPVPAAAADSEDAAELEAIGYGGR